MVTYLVWPFWVLWTLCLYIFVSSQRIKYKGQLAKRLGFDWKIAATPQGVKCWWFHAVSLGETQAVLGLIQRVIEENPQDRIVFSHMTSTGVELAQKQLKDKVEHVILGPDLNFIARYRMQKARPHKLVFVESDVWPSLAYQARAQGAVVAVVNGRLSDRSSDRFSTYGSIARSLWSFVDCCIVQSLFQKELWVKAQMPVEKIQVGGFLKLDRPAPVLDSSVKEKLKAVWPTKSASIPTYFLTLSCTHEPEEKWLLEKLISIAKAKKWHFRVMIAPRHPARFDEVFALIKNIGVPVLRLSEGHSFEEESDCLSVLLVDRMGFLGYCYDISDVCLVAGSWVSHVGGHNILEPVIQAVPTLCGPHVYKQKDIWQLAKQYDLVRQAPLETLWLVHM
jgi:3-deoxy-D-manno-octulosonic-acid transferase